MCAQCHVEYYFIQPDAPKNPGKANYLVFPHDNGLTCEVVEEYYDSIGFYDYIHPLSKTPILKAQAAIGLDMNTLNSKKQRFLQEVVPKWIEEAKKNGKVAN